MALLTDEIQEKLIKLLIDEGLVEKRILDDAETRAKKEDKPLFSLLTEEGVIDNELLTHAVAQVSGVPYVNLSNSFIRIKITCQYYCHIIRYVIGMEVFANFFQ